MLMRLIILLCIIKSGYTLNCLSCDSKYDPNCATLSKNTSATICNDDDNECSIWMNGTSTIRDCSSRRREEFTNFQSCLTGDLCNNAIFPVDRKKCITCSSNNPACIKPTANLLFPCKNYVEDDKCYTYIMNETSVIRGCMSDDNENVALCQSADECMQCSEDVCNNHSGFSQIECISCSSEREPGCGYHLPLNGFYQTRVCEELVGRDNFCVSFSNGSLHYRGCLSEFPAVNVTSCLNSDDCFVCEEDYCNNQQLVKDECVQCDSRKEDCSDSKIFSDYAFACKNVVQEKAGCFHYDRDNITKRGCLSSFSEDDFQECILDQNCKICQGSLCNIKESFQQCYSCSSLDDPNCVTLKSELPRKVCDSYMDVCKVFVKPNMTTHRGCSSEIEQGPECTSLSVNCKQCTDNLCNGGIFPSSRLSCYHCQSSNYSHCNDGMMKNADLSYPCVTYNFRDSCYLYLDKDNITTRGCLSESTRYTDLCLSNPSECEICSTSNCNNKSVIRAPSISCITCDSASDPKCIWGYSESSAAPCLRDLHFYEEESCFTLHVSESTIIRGCTLDKNVCKYNPFCSKCTGNACNIEQKSNLYCYECSTNESSSCYNEMSKVSNVSCFPVTYEHRGCYTWKHGNESISRGCYANLPPTRRFQCMNDRENCDICIDEQNCNDKSFNQCGTLSVNFILLIILLISTCIK